MAGHGDAVFRGNSPEELQAWLETAGVSTAAWGRDAAKSVQFLWAEVQEGESRLQLVAGRPLRLVQVLNVVLRNSQGQTLTEAEQVLPSGSRRRRGLVLSEKLLPDEGWQEAVPRAIREELGPVLPSQPQVRWRRGHGGGSGLCAAAGGGLFRARVVAVPGVPYCSLQRHCSDLDCTNPGAWPWQEKGRKLRRASCGCRSPWTSSRTSRKWR